MLLGQPAPQVLPAHKAFKVCKDQPAQPDPLVRLALLVQQDPPVNLDLASLMPPHLHLIPNT